MEIVPERRHDNGRTKAHDGHSGTAALMQIILIVDADG